MTRVWDSGLCELLAGGGSGQNKADEQQTDAPPLPAGLPAAGSHAPVVEWEWWRSLATEELLGLVLELAAVLHEAWTQLLPVLQRLHFELSCGARVQGASVFVAGSGAPAAVATPAAARPAAPRDDARDSQARGARAASAGGDADVALPSSESAASHTGALAASSPLGLASQIAAPSLLASLECLFTGSHCLPEKAVYILLTELAVLGRDVRRFESFSEQPEAEEPAAPHAGSASDARFGVDQTLVIARHNLFRLHVIWAPISSHLAQVLSHQRAAMRGHGARGYNDLSKEALVFLSRRVEGHTVGEAGALAPDEADDAVASTERQVMRSYQVMYSTTLFSDTKNSILVGLAEVLGCCTRGEIRLGVGWQAVLELLLLVPRESEPALLKQGFECLKLICHGLLEHLPAEDMGRLGQCLQAMGTQDADQPCAQGSAALLVTLADFFSSNRASLLARLAGADPAAPAAPRPGHGSRQGAADLLGEGEAMGAEEAAGRQALQVGPPIQPGTSTENSSASQVKEPDIPEKSPTDTLGLQRQAATVYELLMHNVLKSLLTLGLDRRVKVRG